MPYEGYIIPLPVAMGGYDATENEMAPPANRLIKAFNINFNDGMWQKEGGTTALNGTALESGEPIVGGFDYWPTSSLQVSVVATSNGKILKDDDQSWTYADTLKTGLSTDNLTTFCEGGKETAGAAKHLFIYNGADQVQVLDDNGAATGDISTPAADWASYGYPTKGAVHRNRHWVISGHGLYGSTLSDHEDFTGAGSLYFPVYMGEGTACTSLISSMGRLFVFKRNQIYYLDDSNADSAYWGIKKITSRIGCVGAETMDSGKNEILFISADGGLHYLSGVQEFGDVKDSDISEIYNLNKYIEKYIKRSRLDRANLKYNEEKKTVFVAMAASGSSRNDILIKLYVKDMSNIKISITTKDSCESIWNVADTTSKVPYIMLGTDDGYVCSTDDNTYVDYEGNAYTSEFQYAYTDFGWYNQQLAEKNKIYDFIVVHAVEAGDYSLSCYQFIDGKQISTTPITFNLGIAGVLLSEDGITGFGLSDDLLDGDTLAGDETIIKMAKLYGTGRNLSLSFYNSGSGEYYKIQKIFVYLRVAGDELRS